jgi:SAM-dependent methyltransferase
MQFASPVYEWLLSQEAAPWLARLSGEESVHRNLRDQVRQALGSRKSDYVFQLVHLRRMGLRKFSRALGMFFDRRGLEQSTDERLATYKATLIPPGSRVVDLGCGIGGDACSLAGTSHLFAVDADDRRVAFTAENLRVNGCAEFEARQALAEEIDVSQFDVWHADPDRRVMGKRTVNLDKMRPHTSCCDAWLKRNSNGLLKLAPASRVPEEWLRLAQREWIGHRRECQQLLLRFGDLAAHPGLRTATMIRREESLGFPPGPKLVTLVESPHDPPQDATEILSHIIEPQSSVIAAGLAEQLAAELGFRRFDSGIAFFTGDKECGHPMVSCFRVEAELPLRMNAVRAWLQKNDAFVAEFKRRGVAIKDIFWELRLSRITGSRPVSLLGLRLGRRNVGLIARRCNLF